MTKSMLDQPWLDPDRYLVALHEMEVIGMAGRIEVGVA